MNGKTMNREQLIDKYGEEAFNEALAISGKIIETEVAKVRKFAVEVQPEGIDFNDASTAFISEKEAEKAGF